MRAFVKISGLFFAIFLLNSPLVALAQVVTPEPPSITGTVLDPSGASVPGAEVVAIGRGAPRTIHTDPAGRFQVSIDGEPPFTITVIAPGFAPAVTAGIDGSHPVTISLEPAHVEERVDVVSSRQRGAVSATATRTAAPVLDVPQTIDIVTAAVLREQAATSLADALRNVPAVGTSLGEGRRDQFLIRGFSAQNDTLLDGTRDDAPYYRDVATIDRVEVLKGPAAALFGRGSSGGVINRILKSAQADGAITEGTLSAGSLGSRRVTGDIGRALSDAVSFRIAAAAENSTSFRDASFLRRATVAPSLLWTGRSTSALVQIEYLADHRLPDRGIPSVNGRPADVRIGQSYGYPTDDYIDTTVTSGSVRLERHAGTRWLLRNLTRIGAYNTSFSNTAAIGTSVVNGTWRVARQQYNAEQSQQNTFNQSDAIGSITFARATHLLLAGVELGAQQRNTIRFNGTGSSVDLIDPVLTRPQYSTLAATYNRFSGTTLAAYAQDQLAMGRHWKALVGVRGDRYVQSLDDRRPENVDLARTDVNWSPRAGLVFQPEARTSLYTSVSRSFQPSGEGLSLAASNADLQPEQARNIEGGVKHVWSGGRATATGSVFQLDRSNIRTTDPIDPTRLVLVGRQRTRGIEVAFDGRITDRLHAVAGYAWLDAAVLRSNTVTSGVRIEGNRPGLVAPHAGNVWVSYGVTSALSIAGGVTATADRFATNDDLVRLPGYVRADTAVAWRLRRVDVAINARNLLDRRYVDTASTNFQIAPGAPREVVVTLRVGR